MPIYVTLYQYTEKGIQHVKDTVKREEAFKSRAKKHGVTVNAGARLHRFPEQRCINDADENALEHGLVWCASGWGRIVLGLVDVLAT